MEEIIDVDVSVIITDGGAVEVAGEQVWQEVSNVASGKLTLCEILGEQQLSVSRFGPSV
jgi:altronate dehydratase large subunit